MLKIKIIFLLGFITLSLSNSAQSDHLVIPFTNQFQDSIKAITYLDSAIVNRNGGALKKALLFLDSAMTLMLHLNDSSGLADVFATQSTVYQYQGNQKKAINLLLKAKEIHEANNDIEAVAVDCNNLALIYINQKNYTNAKEYFNVALVVFEKLEGEKAKRTSAAILVNLSAILLKQNQPKKALEFAKKSKIINAAIANKDGLAQSLLKIGDAFFDLTDFEMALKSYFQSLEEISKDNNLSLNASINHQLSKVYLQKKQYILAEQYALKAKSLFKKIGSHDDLRNTFLTLSKIYESSGKPSLALDYYQQYHNSYQNSFNEESDRSQKELLAIYESDKKEIEIALLEKEKRINIEELKRQRFKVISFAFGGLFLTVVAIGLIYYNRLIHQAKDQIAVEKERSENLLLNILPKDVAEELKENGKYRPRNFTQVSVLFADIVNFTHHAEELKPDELVKNIDEYFTAFDKVADQFGIEKIKTIGDAYMAAGGLKGDSKNAAIQTVGMALAFHEKVKEINTKREQNQNTFFELRIGIHTGPIVAGIVGSRKFSYDIWGDTVNLASRMESSGAVNKVNISQNTYELIKDKFQCNHRGKIVAKNKGEVDMYFVDKNI